MAYVTRVRIEGAGESPEEIRDAFDELLDALEAGSENTEQDFVVARVTDEVFERQPNPSPSVFWYKGRRIVWFVDEGVASGRRP